MNNVDILLAANNDFKFIKVLFDNTENARAYTYKSLEDIEEGDFVVVNSPGGMKVVKVSEVVPATEYITESTYAIKWAVGKVDMDNYEACKEIEKQVTIKVNQAEGKKKLNEMREHLNESLGEDAIEEVTKLVRL
jgi:hypothetical protein